jgi:hypothetical protein
MNSSNTVGHRQILDAAFPQTGAPSCPGATSIHVIADNSVPRWILFGDPARALPVLENWHPYALRSRLKWTAVKVAAGCGVLSRLPIILSEQACVDHSYWRCVLPVQPDWTPVIYVGNPSPTRKITLFFVGSDARIQAVAKTPLSNEAGPAILNEADRLAAFGDVPYAPGILLRDRTRGISVQSWLHGSPVSRRLTRAHIHLLDSLRIGEATTRVSDSRSALLSQLDATDLPFDRALLDRASELLQFDQPLPAFIEHGDFAPWNLKRLRDGSIGAIDWEWSLDRGLPCQDLCRFFYVQDALFHGPGKVWHALTRHPLLLEHFRRHGIPQQALLPLVTVYLFRTLLTYGSGVNPVLAQHAFRELADLIHAHRDWVGLLRALAASAPTAA